MPTVEELEISYRDSVSAGAKAATDSLNKMADAMDRTGASADTVDTKVTRTTKSATGWVNSLDNVTKSSNALTKAQSDLAAMQDRLAKGVADGSVAQDQATRAIAAQEDKIAALTKRHADYVDATGKSTDATKAGTAAGEEQAGTLDKVAAAFGVHRTAVIQSTDELHKFVDQVLAGGSALTAGFYQLPNIGNALGGFGNIAKVVGGFLVGPGGLVVAGVAVAAAFGAMGVSAERQQEQLASLSQQLRATRTDYDAMAAATIAAARQASSNGSISTADALTVGKTFDGVGTVSSSQLLGLTRQAQDLAAVLGVDVPDAAKQMAAAMADPEKAAEDFAQRGLLGVREELAQQVKALQDSGDKLGAYALLMGQVTDATRNAQHDGLTPFQQALEDLSHAFNDPVSGAKSLSKAIGDEVVLGATVAIKEIQNVVDALNYLRTHAIDGSVLPSGSGSASAGAANASASSTIDSVGQSLGANADVIALAHRIQPIESSTGQYTASGSVVMGPQTASGQAVGAMQVMPFNANGNDLTTTTGNITAGEQYLIQLYNKYNGNQVLVAMAYNWGPQNVDDYINHKTNSVPQSVQDYAQQATGGVMYSATTIAAKQSSIGDAERTTDSSTTAQMQAEQRAIDQISAAQQNLNDLHNAGIVSDASYADETAKLTDRLNSHKGILIDLRDPMQQLAHQQDLAAQGAATYSAAEQAMVSVDQQVEDAAHRMGQAHASASDILAGEARQQAILTDQFNASIAAIDRQTNSQNQLIAGYDGTQGSLAHYTDAEKAAETVRATSLDDTAEQTRQTTILTNALDANRISTANLATAQGLLAKQQSLQTVNAQIGLLGTNSDSASRSLAALAEHQDLVRRYGSEAAVAASDQAQKEAALSDSVEVATLSYQRQKQTLSDVTSSLSSMADTIGDDITQAFIQGSGSSVTFKSALQGVETQVLSLIAKLALINPILNAIDGGSRSTISSLLGLFSGSGGSLVGGTSSGSAGGGSILGSLGSAGSLLGSAGSGGGILSSLGLGGVGSSISGLLATNLWGGTSAASAIATSGDINAAYSTTAGLGGTSLGSLLGGAGAGFAAGSLLNSLAGGNKTGGTIGSGVGAAAGAAIGSIIPGVGTLIGGLLGGAAGGGLGGLFGGHKANPYTIDTVSTTGGSLSLSSSYNQAETDGVTAQLQSDIASLNATFKSLGLTVSNGNGDKAGRLGLVGDGSGNTVSSIAGILNAVRLSGGSGSFQTALNSAQSGGFSTSDLSSVSSFEAAITTLKSMADAVDALHVKVSSFNADAATVTVGGSGSFSGGYSSATAAALDHALDGTTTTTANLQTNIATIVTFVESTMPQLLQATTTGQSSFQTSIASLTATYTAAEQQAASLGISTDGLSSKLSSLTVSMYSAAQTTLDYQTGALQVRDLTATGDAEGAALLNQHLSAEQERTAFDQSWQAIYGDAYQQAQGYGAASAELSKTQADEQLAIQKQYADAAAAAQQQSAAAAQSAQQQADQAAAAAQQQLVQANMQIWSQLISLSQNAQSSAASVVTSLSTYATSLTTSDLSPLSAADQYTAANDNYATDLAKARGGDFGAIQSFQTDANSLLTASKSYNGSGTGYANDYTRVLQDLQSIVGMGSDALTQSALNAAIETQTDTLNSSLQTAVTNLQSILLELQQANQRKAA